MVEKKVPYQVNGRQFEGMIVYDDSVKAKRPVVFMQPDWKGVCADTVGQARAVAGKDYVVLMPTCSVQDMATSQRTRISCGRECWRYTRTVPLRSPAARRPTMR